MAATLNFSEQVFRHGISSKTCKFEQNKLKVMQQGLKIPRKNANMMMNKWGFGEVMKSNRNSSFIRLMSHSASDTVRDFYMCINDGKLKQLSDYIAQDCCFDDCSFSLPFHGRKKILQYFEQLTASMGPNVKFNIKHVCEGLEFNAAINWHLEWKKTRIPFTRGCSFFECSKEADRLVIKKAEVMVESPIKPGITNLTILKTLVSLFDNFPKTAEWALKSPPFILEWLLKIYTLFLVSFVTSFLKGHIKLGTFIAELLACTFKILVRIARTFFN